MLCNSSDLLISYLMAVSIKAPTLYASKSVLHFNEQNAFINNNVRIPYRVYILFFKSCHCNFSGNVSFVGNTGVTTVTRSFDDIDFYTPNLIPSFLKNDPSAPIGSVNFVGGIAIILGNVSFVNNTAATGGSQVLYYGATCNITGNVSFLQNIV